MSRPIMKELALEPCKENLDDVANFLDNAHEFKKVKTKYAKEGWDAVSLHGYLSLIYLKNYHVSLRELDL